MDHYNRLRFAEHLAPTCQKYGTVPVTEFQKVSDRLWELKREIAAFCDTISAQTPTRKNLVLLAENHFDITGAIAAVMFAKHLQGRYDCYLEGSGSARDDGRPRDLLSTDLIAYLDLFPVTRLDTQESSNMADALREVLWAVKVFPDGVADDGGKIALIGGNHVVSFAQTIRRVYAGFDTFYRAHAVQLYPAGMADVAGAPIIRLAQDAATILTTRFPTQLVTSLGPSRMQPRTLFIVDVATAVFTFEEVAVSPRCKPD